MFKTIKKIHFVGIGGIGMSGIAEILLNSGYNVSGSDTKASAVTERLAQIGAIINIGHDAKAVNDTEVVVISSAINKHNPEILEAITRKIPIIHRSEMLAELMRLKYGIVVSGTHGKTTTTSLLATTLTAAKLDPTVVIGGKLNSIGSNAKAGEGDIFLAEGCESDKSFLKLTPTIAVITNIDKDHMDHYGSFDEILHAFESFVAKVPFYGCVCACIDDPGVQLLLPSIERKLITFGLRPDADITARNITAQEMSMRFTPVVFGKELSEVHLQMPGKYNVSNALATYAVACALNIELETINAALSSFAGVLHRNTLVGSVKNIKVIDDYAHNPKKISSCLSGLREGFPHHYICAIFQPHRFSRLKHLATEFSQSFRSADSVIITPIYSAGEQNLAGISQEYIAQLIEQNSFNGSKSEVFIASSLQNAADLSSETALKTAQNSPGVIIVTMGAGDIANLGNIIIANLEKNI